VAPFCFSVTVYDAAMCEHGVTKIIETVKTGSKVVKSHQL